MGRQKFTYDILPHRGALSQSAAVRAGFYFNSPLRFVDGFVDLPKIPVTRAPNVVLGTIRKLEEGEDLVMRAYEEYGGAAVAVVNTSLKVRKALKVNLLEEEVGPLEAKSKNTGNSISLAFKTFEVVTLQLTVE